MVFKSLSLYTILFIPSMFWAQNVGINTTDPQQKLHVAGTNSNIRIDAFNTTNNPHNGSATITAPLYVDEEGVLSLDFVPYYASGGNDDFDGTTTTSSITQTNSETVVESVIFTKEITVTRPSYVHITYSISFSISDEYEEKITDGIARIIKNYIKLQGYPRQYATVAQCYVNESANGANFTLFNSASAYIELQEAGTYTIEFYGGVGSGSLEHSTIVNFGLAQDMLLMRLF